MRKIIQNEIECVKCGDRVYSAHRHDFKYCKCGDVAVDGGVDYLRRVGNGEWVDRSMSMDADSLTAVVEAVKWGRETKRNDLGIALAVIRALRNADCLNMVKFKPYDA